MIFYADVGQNIGLLGVYLFLVHRACLRNRRFHFGDPRFEESLGFLCGVVLCIFGQVALFPRFLNRSGNTGTLFCLQEAQLFLEFFEPLTGQVYDI